MDREKRHPAKLPDAPKPTAEGIHISFGSEDIFAPRNSLGNANMRDVVFMSLYAGHMLGYDEIMGSCKFVTSNAARSLHWPDTQSDAGGHPGKRATTHSGVFAAGDVVTGGKTVVHAVEAVKNAAQPMMRYMEQETAYPSV